MRPLIIITALVLLCSCQPINRGNGSSTTIGTKEITNEIAGSAYRKRATGYFVINNGDTSRYMPIFTESNEGDGIGLDLNIRLDDSVTYRRRMAEIKSILPTASKDYNFDSLQGIYIGTLVETGDLDVLITRQFLKDYGRAETSDILRNQLVAKFLIKSQLATDFNKLLQPYGLSVYEAWVEKVHFTPKSSLSFFAKIETDTAVIPPMVLNGSVGLSLKKN